MSSLSGLWLSETIANKVTGNGSHYKLGGPVACGLLTDRPTAAPEKATHERSTRQKRALGALLDTSAGFRSAQDLFGELRERGENVGLTTIYNQLRALADAGEVDVWRSDDGETLYRRCRTDQHHHHLVCRRCGRTVEVEGPEVEGWADQVAALYDFVDVVHTLEIVGTCAGCAT